MPEATLGRVVNYTTATGNVVTAQVVGTQNSVSPGRYVNVMSAEERATAISKVTEDRYSGDSEAKSLDHDGDRWVPSPVPQPKPGRVHLKITAPNGNSYVEFNVPEDDNPPSTSDTPGTPTTYHWPPR